MQQVTIGAITIGAVIEREGPWRRPQDFFPLYDETTFMRHLPMMEPEVFDVASGRMCITYQTFVVRTPHHTISADTWTGEYKGHPPPFDFLGKERWRNELFALRVCCEQIDHVFCTHLNIDHTSWNTTQRDARRALQLSVQARIAARSAGTGNGHSHGVSASDQDPSRC